MTPVRTTACTSSPTSGLASGGQSIPGVHTQQLMRGGACARLCARPLAEEGEEHCA